MPTPLRYGVLRKIVGLIKKNRINPAEAANSLLKQASLFQPGDESPGVAHELPNALNVISDWLVTFLVKRALDAFLTVVPSQSRVVKSFANGGAAILMETVVIPKPAYNVLRRLTGESRPDVALSLALKDLVRLRLEAARSMNTAFEQKYGMAFSAFEQEWNSGKVPGSYTYPVEKDYWDWEAAATDIAALEELAQWLV